MPASRSGRVVRMLALALVLVASAGKARGADAPQVLAWSLGSDANALRMTKARAPGLTAVSPTWWALRQDGTVSSTFDPRFASEAHRLGLRLWPLFANRGDARASHLVLSDAARRRDVILRVADLAREAGADGVNLDWEQLDKADVEAFTAFVREASDAWRARGLIVSIDVAVGDVTAGLDGSVDWIIMMAYDEHRPGGPAGPTASLPWVERGIHDALRHVSAKRLALGLPLYTYDWTTDSTRASVLSFGRTPARLAAVGATSRWDDALGGSVARFVEGGLQHTVWVEDERSLKRKASLARKHGLGGVAAWRLGFDSPGAWRAIDDALRP